MDILEGWLIHFIPVDFDMCINQNIAYFCGFNIFMGDAVRYKTYWFCIFFLKISLNS